MKKFRLTWIKKRVFTVITDSLPYINTMFVNIVGKFNIITKDATVYLRAISEIKNKLSMSISNFRFISELETNISQNIRIVNTLIARYKYILSSKLHNTISISTNMQQIVKDKISIKINCGMKAISRLIISVTENNNPVKIRARLKVIAELSASMFRKLADVGCKKDNKETNLVQLGAMDNLTMKELDNQNKVFVYWNRAIPESPISPLYCVNSTNICDELYKTDLKWTIKRYTTHLYIDGNSAMKVAFDSRRNILIDIDLIKEANISESFATQNQFVYGVQSGDAYFNFESNKKIHMQISSQIFSQMFLELPSEQTEIEGYMREWFNYKPLIIVYKNNEMYTEQVDNIRQTILDSTTCVGRKGQFYESVVGSKSPVNPSKIVGVGTYGAIVENKK